MSLSNLNNAANIKTFIVKCFPTELVRVEVTHSGFIKKVNYREYIHYISVEGGVPVEHTSIDSLANDHDWYHDRANGVLYYYIADELADIVITFGFFFKTGDTEPFHVDVSNTATPLVMYDGRMLETSFIQSIDDVSNGTLAISSTTISLINNDGYYQTLARDEVSFKKSYIEVRIFYNEVTNNVVVFTGSIESASFRSKEVIIEVKDINKILQNVAKMTAIESEYITDSVNLPEMPTENIGKEIPYLLGRCPSYSMKKISNVVKFGSPGSGGIPEIETVGESWDQGQDDQKLIAWKNGNKSIPIYDGYTRELTGYQAVRCRTYLGYRTINSIKTQAKIRLYQANIVDLNSAFTTSNEYGSEVEIPVSNVDDYFLGQLCHWHSAKGMGFGSDAYPDSGPPYLDLYTFRVSYLNYDDGRIRICPTISKIAVVADAYGRSDIFFMPFNVSLFESDQNIYINKRIIENYGRSESGHYRQEFTVSRYSTGYGYNYLDQDKKLKVGGINTKKRMDETTFPVNDNSTELEPNSLTAKFTTETTNLSLGCILHRVLIEAGYQTDGGTSVVLAAGTNSFRHLDTKLGTTYWTLHTGMVDTYLELLQMMLSSVFGFMYVQADGRIGVRLFEKIPYASSVWNLSEDDIVKDSIISDFNSGGVCTRLRSTNNTNAEFMVESTSSIKRLLHGDVALDNKYYFESQSIYQAKVMPRKFEYLSNSVRKFDFTVINNGYDILLGDRISVSFPQSNKWLGTPKQYDLFVIAVNKALQGTTVTAIENIFPELP